MLAIRRQSRESNATVLFMVGPRAQDHRERGHLPAGDGMLAIRRQSRECRPACLLG